MIFLQRLFVFSILFLEVSTLFAFNPYSSEELDTLEKEFVRQINQSEAVIRDPLLTSWLNDLNTRLSKNASMRKPSFFIVNSPEINAFAGPGGHIGINTALIVAAESESELASVMAHEMAHVRLNHLYNMIEHQKQMRLPMLATLLASAALGAINPALASGAMLASLSGFAEHNIHYTRAKEKEADRIGIHILLQAGMDPRGMIAFFKKMQLQSRYYYNAHIPAILRTHPLDEDRIAEAENRLPKSFTPISSHPDFFMFRERVRVKATRNLKGLFDFYQSGCHQQKRACEYGLALTELKSKRLGNTLERLKRLESENNSLFVELSIAETYIELGQFDAAVTYLDTLQKSYPDNYAILMTKANALRAHQKYKEAAVVLLKGSRIFKTDLSLCHAHAESLAASGQKAYAYFVDAKCEELQGRTREALRSLREAKTLAPKEGYLALRIQAMEQDLKAH